MKYEDMDPGLAEEIHRYELRIALDHVPSLIFLKDAHNIILRANKSAADSMGRTIEEVEGQDTYDLYPELAAKYHKDDLEVINSGEPKLGIIEEATPLNAPRRWVSTDKIPYTDPVTGKRFVIVVATDITDLKAAQERLVKRNMDLERTNAKLKKANQELDQFAYMASHDLRSPLKGLDNLTDWIAADLGDKADPEVTRMLGLMKSRVSRMERMLRDMQAFSALGRDMPAPVDIDLAALLDEIIGYVNQKDGFAINRPDDLPVVQFPLTALEQIFANLISNALKHHDRAEGVIDITYTRTADRHIFHIRDDGPGIDPEYHDYVFEMFKKLKSRDDVEGSGIGLAIVQKLAMALGGEILLTSEKDKRGTTFELRLPHTYRSKGPQQ